MMWEKCLEIILCNCNCSFYPVTLLGYCCLQNTTNVSTSVRSLKMLNCTMLSAPYLPNQNNRTGYATYDIPTSPPYRNNILLPSG